MALPSKPQATPPSEDKLRLLIANGATDVAQQLIETWKLNYKIENGQLVDTLVGTDLWLKLFATCDPDMLQMKRDVVKLAAVDDEVLITGETGTGKELIARAMIGNRKGAFVAVNCAGLPENLIESELFGHVKGSFTGAEVTKKGLLLAASEPEPGVLFLDEIGELPLSVQGKLLRALQDKRIRRVGSNQEEDIKCKFVCATHRNIKQMVENGQFRQDLYARISTFELHIKPLRERKADIRLICETKDGGKEFMRIYEQNILNDKLDWSLNVRSLEQYIKRHRVLGRV